MTGYYIGYMVNHEFWRETLTYNTFYLIQWVWSGSDEHIFVKLSKSYKHMNVIKTTVKKHNNLYNRYRRENF